MAILVTGGTGYIGSHTVVELHKVGYDVVIVDNLCNSKELVLDRIETISGKRPKFYKVSVQDEAKMREILEKEDITDVIHFAGLKSVGESVQKPELYFENNVGSTKVLLKLMNEFSIKNIVFSSSATVYGNPDHVPVKEEDKVGGCTNPYGQTKLDIEFILKDYNKLHADTNIAILRYFNPIGAHASGLIGEDPNGIPNNLMPYITKVATGKLKELSIFGNDYPTKDGTGVRDYIHVCDLAVGHVLALEKLNENPGVFICNLGTGNGYSVLEIVNTFNAVNGNLVKFKYVERRAGDIAICYADTTKAKNELNFVARRTLEDMCKSSYEFEKNNNKN